jgi:hypothetical protein
LPGSAAFSGGGNNEATMGGDGGSSDELEEGEAKRRHGAFLEPRLADTQLARVVSASCRNPSRPHVGWQWVGSADSEIG